MYKYDNQLYLNFNEMMDDVRWDYYHGDRDMAMQFLSEEGLSLSGI